MKRNFTFTELCVVCCGILFLSVLMLPLIARTTNTATATGCIDKLHRIAETAFAYADDFGDYTVPHRNAKTLGWVRVLSAYQPSLDEDAYHCPDDAVKRNFDAKPISYSLNLGHIWNVRQSRTNRKEWGTASVITGQSVLLSSVPIPTETTWIFEYHSPDNNYRQLCNHNDRALFTPYTISGFHDNAERNTMLFLDGRVERIDKNTWKRGDSRGVLFKDLHASGCSPNLP